MWQLNRQVPKVTLDFLNQKDNTTKKLIYCNVLKQLSFIDHIKISNMGLRKLLRKPRDAKIEGKDKTISASNYGEVEAELRCSLIIKLEVRAAGVGVWLDI